MRTMYEVIGKNKAGNSYVWELSESITGDRVCVKSDELKVLVQRGQIYNAVIRSNKIVEVPHALKSLMLLSKKIGDAHTVHVNYVMNSTSGNRVHIKLYNSKGEDLTEAVYMVITRSFKSSQCSLTESHLLSLDTGKRVHDILPEINRINKIYGLYVEPLVDEKLYRFVAN